VITDLTSLVIVRAIVLNGIAGLVLGWLYWKRGLESAMIVHFTADLMILIVLPAILA
jgi:membrane protease YdiL (CAAX protease family)